MPGISPQIPPRLRDKLRDSLFRERSGLGSMLREPGLRCSVPHRIELLRRVGLPRLEATLPPYDMNLPRQFDVLCAHVLRGQVHCP